MAIRITIDGNTMSQSIDTNMNMIAALTGKPIKAEELKAAMDMQPKNVSCVGYEYTRSIDGTITLVITDETCKRVNGFMMTWGPAIAGLLVGFKAQIKAAKKFAKTFIRAHKGLVKGLLDDMKIDGMNEDEWVEKKVHEASEAFDKITKFNKRVVDKTRSTIKTGLKNVREETCHIDNINPDEVDDLNTLYDLLKKVKTRMYSEDVKSDSREWDDLVDMKIKIRRRIRELRKVREAEVDSQED